MNSLRLLHELTQSTNMVHDVEASDGVRNIILPNNFLYQLASLKSGDVVSQNCGWASMRKIYVLHPKSHVS